MKGVDFRLVLWTAGAVIERIAKGTIGLPDFQRRFEWSTADVKALLSTVLGGLPSGSIMIASNEALGVALRELEGAPPIRRGSDVLALLDGQQRLTSLFHGATNIGPIEYAVDLNAISEGASLLEDDVIRSRRRGRPWSSTGNDLNLVPVSALRNDHSFYSWLHSTSSRGATSRMTDAFAEHIHPIDSYEIPITELGGRVDLATLAQIFERTNKWGQRLDAFDLLVARLQSGGWSLRGAWEDATQSRPAIGRVFGENGLPAVSAIALSEAKSVRRNAVLSLPPGLIESRWEETIEAADRVAQLLLDEGVRRPELLSYDSVATVMIAASAAGVGPRLLRRYYWLASFNRWHEVASNTRVVSDFRALRDGMTDSAMPTEVPSSADLALSTRRNSRALWSCLVAVMLRNDPKDLVTGQSVSSPEPAAQDRWELVPLVSGGGSYETSSDVPARLRTTAHIVAAEGSASRLRRRGVQRILKERAQQPTMFDRPLGDDLASQLLPRDLYAFSSMTPREIVMFRATSIREMLEASIELGFEWK